MNRSELPDGSESRHQAESHGSERSVRTGKAFLEWRNHPTLGWIVVKRLTSRQGRWRQLFDHEIKVNQAFVENTPPFMTAKMVSFTWRPPAITFRAIDGMPLSNQRYPSGAISRTVIGHLVDYANAVTTYPPPSDVAEFPIATKLATYKARGAITVPEYLLIQRWLLDNSVSQSFGHGDFLPMNLLATATNVVAVDWEFAGRYPVGYDLALLWLSLCVAKAPRDAILDHVANLGPAWQTGFVTSSIYLVLREIRINQTEGGDHRLLAPLRRARALVLACLRRPNPPMSLLQAN